MKISGAATMAASPDQVWQAVHDPAVLARCIPGCESLRELSPGRYAMTVTAGVAAIKGSYDGEVAITDVTEPTHFTMKADGAGAPGTIATTVDVRLSEEAGGTAIAYDADATVGGPIGGVGQRMLAGVARKMAGQMFTSLDRDIAGERPAAAEPEMAGAAGTTAEGTTPTGTGAAQPQVYAGRTATANAHLAMDRGTTFALGALVGGALALAGVLVGARVGRR